MKSAFLKAALVAIAAALPLAAAARIVRHRSFSQGIPVTPSTSPNARAYPIGTGMVTREATPAFDFLSSGRFAVAHVHFGDSKREIVSGAGKAGVLKISERPLDGGMLELLLEGGPTGILVGRTGAQGAAQTEYRAGRIRAVIKAGRTIAISAEFAAAEEGPLAAFRDWVVKVFDRRAKPEGPAIDVIPKAGFGASADKTRSRAWRDTNYRYELRYDSDPSRLTVIAARPEYFRER